MRWRVSKRNRVRFGKPENGERKQPFLEGQGGWNGGFERGPADAAAGDGDFRLEAW